MRAILSDVNIEGQVRRLVQILEAEPWRELWVHLNLSLLTVPDLGLTTEASDEEIWKICQAQRIVLLTANRNHDGPDSLEAVIRTQNQPDCLPVFTLADADNVIADRRYAPRVAESLIEYLYDMPRILGAGRMYLP